MTEQNLQHSLELMLRKLKLPTFAGVYEQVALHADREGWTLGQALRHLCELELEERRVRKIERLLKASNLPADKTFATVDVKRWPPRRSGSSPRCDPATFSTAPRTCSCSACRGAGRRTCVPRSATSSSGSGGPSTSHRRPCSCSDSCAPSAT